MHKILFFITVFLGPCIGFGQFSQSDTTISTALNKAHQTQIIPEKNNSLVLQTQVEGMNYLTEIPDEPALDSSTLLSVDFTYQRIGQSWGSGIDLSAGQVLENQFSHLGVHEIFVKYGQGSWVNPMVTLGRKKKSFSQLDSDWNLGLWQPTYGMDSLRLEQEGLTGLFIEAGNKNWFFLAFASPMFVPSMGPEIENKEGTLSSRSRWFRPPSKTFSLLEDRKIRLRYSLDVPDKEKLVMNPASAISVAYNTKDSGLFAVASGGYKPINSLVLKYQRTLVLAETQDNVGEVVIEPGVGYHSILSADVGYRWEKVELRFSQIKDNPSPVSPEIDYIKQQPMGLTARGVKLKIVQDIWSSSIGYLQISDGFIQDFDDSGQPSGAIFDRRWNFSDSARLDLDFSYPLFGMKTSWSSSYLRDFSQDGVLVSASLAVFPTQNFAIKTGVDVLGPDNSESPEDLNGFLNQFRSNDRAYAGMIYVF